VDADPTDVNNIYPLALAYLTAGPTEKPLDGLWFIARAANLISDPKAKADVIKFGKSKYVKYHGPRMAGTNCWPRPRRRRYLLPISPLSNTFLPLRPTSVPIWSRRKRSRRCPLPSGSYASRGRPEDSEKVWNALNGKPLAMVGHIISIDSPKNLKLAGSQDDIDAKRADIDLTMTAAIPARQMRRPIPTFSSKERQSLTCPSPS